MEKTDVLIIGAGPAGLAAAEAAAKGGAAVTLAGAEPYLPYWRPRLSQMLAQPQKPEDIAIKTGDWFAKNLIDFRPGHTAVHIDIKNKSVYFKNGIVLKYRKLIVAAGSVSNIPPVRGVEKPYALRSYDDCAAIRKDALDKKRAAVIGGGLLGLETAYSLKEAGAEVLVSERNAYLLHRQLPKEGGDFLAFALKKHGIRFLFNSGGELPEEWLNACVIIAAGVRPNTSFLQDTGISIGKGILADARMAANIPDVYACGDVAEFKGKCPGLIPVAFDQGKVAGINAAGGDAVYKEAPPSPMLKVGDLSVFSTGDNAGGKVLYEDAGESFKSVTLKEGVLTGGVLIGDIRLMAKLKKAVSEKRKFPDTAGLFEILEAL